MVISHNWDELRRFMWDYVGIVRTNKRLQRAQHRIDLLKQEINEYYANYRISDDLIELRNLLHVAELIVQCAAKRTESRGLHFTLDYPDTNEVAEDTILFPGSLDHLDMLRPSALGGKARFSMRRRAAQRTGPNSSAKSHRWRCLNRRQRAWLNCNTSTNSDNGR